ncbi:MAG: hypothetical protein JJV98_00440 [Desulfosarcina sp.]|nr:hypothetical protein [Desulfobacterales bacterium]
MKIENDHLIKAFNAIPPSAEPTGDQSFNTLFNQTLEAAAPGPDVSEAVASTRAPIATNLPGSGNSYRHAAVSAFEDLLGSLGTYQERLGDGQFSLKILEHDLNRITDHCRQLDSLTRDLTPDGDLSLLLKEGLATARVEIERFHRGDYC